MEPFEELVERFLDHEFEVSPVRASGLGLTDYDERLDDLSADAFRRRDAEDERWLARFEGPEDPGGRADGLSFDERLDRDLARSVLRGRRILADWEEWRRDPTTYSGPIANGVFGLFLHRLRPEPDLVDAAVARLEQVPRALEQGRANLDPALAHPLILERGAGSARGAARYFRELVASEVEPGPDRDRLAAAGARAAGALDGWVAFLEALRERAGGTWRLGEERYSRLLREREALAFDARELRERGRAEFDRLDAEMRELARRARGTEDWVAVLRDADRDHPPTEEAMRAAYEAATDRARRFLAETGLVTLPDGERCRVEPSPVFQRPILGVASYMAPPSFADTLVGHFFVPFAPDGTPEAERRLRLSANSHGHIPTTAAHEAYPGHHWHLVMRKLGASRLRRVFGTPYFNEGWALYAERVMRERGYFGDPIEELYHLKATIFRAARIVVDTSLHLGEMEHDAAVRFLVERTATPEPTARAEVGRYCAWPTQASAYLTGCLEVLRIRERFLARRGGAGLRPTEVPVGLLREFHDAITSAGSLPLGLAERAVLERPPA